MIVKMKGEYFPRYDQLLPFNGDAVFPVRKELSCCM